MTAIGTFIAGTYTALCTSFAQCIPHHNNHNHDDQDQPRLKGKFVDLSHILEASKN